MVGRRQIGGIYFLSATIRYTYGKSKEVSAAMPYPLLGEIAKGLASPVDCLSCSYVGGLPSRIIRIPGADAYNAQSVVRDWHRYPVQLSELDGSHGLNALTFLSTLSA